MTIKTNQEGFTTAELRTTNHAKLYARFIMPNVFHVNMRTNDCEGDGWSFDKSACREAARFFTQLSEELIRRSYEEVPF